jgi:hypothetical protein
MNRVWAPALLLVLLLVGVFASSPANAAGPGRYCGLLLYPNAVPQGPARRNRTNFALTTDSEKDVVAWYAQHLPDLRVMPESGGRVLFLNPYGKNWSFTIESLQPGQVRIVFNCDWARTYGGG